MNGGRLSLATKRSRAGGRPDSFSSGSGPNRWSGRDFQVWPGTGGRFSSDSTRASFAGMPGRL
jgi:hypothetical protein